ncbi:MAG TPA: hypothetical protein PK396_11625 [Mesotoga sp.]|nr:hypothetical protein [Mesotoga sp.]
MVVIIVEVVDVVDVVLVFTVDAELEMISLPVMKDNLSWNQ